MKLILPAAFKLPRICFLSPSVSLALTDRIPGGKDKLTPGVKPAAQVGWARRQWPMLVVSSMGGKVSQRAEKGGMEKPAKRTVEKRQEQKHQKCVQRGKK